MRITRQTKNSHFSTIIIADWRDAMKKAIFPKEISDAEFRRFLFAVARIERFPARETKKGRRPRFDRNELLNAARKIKGILERETDERISLLHFISNCLPALDYPPDVRRALDNNKINLDEARQLARINRRNLGTKTSRKAVEIRRELLESHLRREGTQKELRERVNTKLGATARQEARTVSFAISEAEAKIDSLLELNEFDTDHLLWEEIKALVFLAREIDPGIIDEEAVVEIIDDLGKIMTKLLKYKKKAKSIDLELSAVAE